MEIGFWKKTTTENILAQDVSRSVPQNQEKNGER